MKRISTLMLLALALALTAPGADGVGAGLHLLRLGWAVHLAEQDGVVA